MDNLFCISINKIVFFIIITYILYICTFINIVELLIVIMIIIITISIFTIISVENNLNCIFIKICYIVSNCQCKSNLCSNK